jgi:uncharacterized membrane protein YedE/YeeE
VSRKRIATLVAGALFGAGLVVSGMTDPRNVIGFLDFSGHWNPRLIAVISGAVVVYAGLLRLLDPIVRGVRPLPARNNRIDVRLVVGAAIFGVGWGLSGYCPGPAIVSLGSGARGALAFVAAMIVGILAAGALARRRSGCETR